MLGHRYRIWALLSTVVRLTSTSLLCFYVVINRGRCYQVVVKSGDSADKLPGFEFSMYQLCDLEQVT